MFPDVGFTTAAPAQAFRGEPRFLRAAFIAYEPNGYPDKRRLIPFRFNPEGLTRTVAAEGGQRPAGVEAGRGKAPAPSGEAPADAAAASVKESFTVHIRLDYAERDPSVSGLAEEFGIAPEIAAIEELMYPAQTDADRSSDGTEAVRAASPRPTVLLVWGRKRILPVRITSLKIDETVHNTELHPVRAELEASLEVLGEPEAKADAAVRAALDNLSAHRRAMARMYYDTTSTQGSFTLPL
jgi:hypothetical protein